MKKKKQKYYVVWEGRETGIATTWRQCEHMTFGVSGAKYKSFTILADAEQAFEDGPEKHWGK